ncbi:MAG: hypothetical protein ACTSUU_06895 [Candidatus Thorarchaeota archaeon]
MSTITRHTAHFQNLIVGGSKLNTGLNSSAHAVGMSVQSEAQVSQIEIVQIDALNLTVTDNGDSTGGFHATAMVRLPPTRLVMVGSFIDFTINSIETGLLDGNYALAVGTAAATDSTHTSTQVNILASTNLTVSSGTGTLEVTSVFPTAFDATTDMDIFLNIGVPDASITTDADLNATGTFRFIYLDLSGGL